MDKSSDYWRGYMDAMKAAEYRRALWEDAPGDTPNLVRPGDSPFGLKVTCHL